MMTRPIRGEPLQEVAILGLAAARLYFVAQWRYVNAHWMRLSLLGRVHSNGLSLVVVTMAFRGCWRGLVVVAAVVMLRFRFTQSGMRLLV